MPGTHSPGQRLDSGHAAVGGLADECMDSHLSAAALVAGVISVLVHVGVGTDVTASGMVDVPVVTVGIDADDGVTGRIAAQVGILGTGGMEHRADGLERLARNVTGVTGEQLLIQRHWSPPSPFRCLMRSSYRPS